MIIRNKEMAKIIKNNKVKDGIFLMSIEDNGIAKSASPGQFVHIRVSDTYYPLLRRPLSIHNTEGPVFEILYKVIGIGTKILSEKKEGEKLDAIGPLGKGFNSQLAISNSQLAIIIGGGMGVAPLYFLAKVINSKLKTQNSKLKILLGAKNKDQLIYEKFEEFGNVSLTTEDGSIEYKGLVTDLLLSTLNSQLSTLFACGPIGMLRIVKAFAIKHKIPCEMSLEENMCCGIGACLSCAVKVRTQKSEVRSQISYKYVCKDGPVFKAEEIEI